MTDIKRIDIKEFREKGYLQEVNRRFFHLLGLALEVEVNEDGTEALGGVWDYRDDPEGMVYGDEMIDTEKVLSVQAELDAKINARQKMFGWFLQPYEIPPEPEDEASE